MNRTASIVVLSPRRSLVGLSSQTIAVDGDAPPSEFRLFRAGENETTKGVFLFDDKAAALVMAASKERGGVDYPIDLEHLSLEGTDSRGFDPDARGWFALEVRNGELWAVNVRWTPDGTRRLSEKTQRYVSPAFTTDEDNRVTEIVNVALVAMPATHGTPALVAAGRRHKPMTLAQRLALIALLTSRMAPARTAMVKLAEGEGEAPSGKFAAIQAAAVKASEALAALESPGGVDEGMAAIDAAKAAVDEFIAAVGAMAGGAPPPAAEVATSDDPEKTEQMARDLAELRTLRAEKAREVETKKVEKLAAEIVERRELVAALVRLGRETPATAWADEAAITPKGTLATMPLVELREKVKAFSGAPGSVTLSNVRPPSGRIEAGGGVIEMSEFEAARVKAYADRRAVELKSAGLTPRETDEIVSRYVGHREQQFRGAKTDDQVKRLGRAIEQHHVLLSRDGKLVKLASVTPHDTLGPSSQRNLEEFRMNYNMTLAAEPKVWAEALGDMMPSGSMAKDTFPINLSALRYRKRTAQDAAAEKALNFDISVTKEEFNAAAQAELRRLNAGDFAYVQWWGNRAAQMARARVHLRNQLVTAILEAGESGYWGSSSELATGIDGQPFFSATHKVHPRDPSKKLRTSATWSNLQASAKPLTAGNLTAEKQYAFQVADPAGYEFGFEYDTLLVPSSLNEVAKNLITVQDIILDPANQANSFGATRNPHFQSGMGIVRAPDLAGTDTTADWYEISRAALSSGLVPWLISEDGAEDLRTWDETSDFCKDSGEIKVSSHIYTNAVLMFPHGIRKVSGA